MSFTAFDHPKVGEVARCKRCVSTFITTKCECGAPEGQFGVAMWPAGAPQSGVTEEIGARLVADRSCEFCPRCWTEDERCALAMKQELQERGQASN